MRAAYRNGILTVVVLSLIGLKYYYRSQRVDASVSDGGAGEVAVNYDDLVYDNEKLFSKEQKDWLNYYHSALLYYYDIDLRIVTGEASPDKVVGLFKQKQIGERSKTRKGMLLAIDSKSDKVRLEISAGLDAVYTDGFVAYLQQKQMVPFFKANQVANGILATTEMVVTRAKDAAAGKEFISPEQLPKNLAIGAGAQTKASIGSGYEVVASSNPAVAGTGTSPTDVVAAYHKILAEGNTAYNLAIYSAATQEMRKSWVVTPAQMRNELSSYAKCSVDKVFVEPDGSAAVVRYGVKQRACAPYLLVKEGGRWKLDFASMMKNIRFGMSNSWHFADRTRIPHAGAFADWQFDKNGYPYPTKKLRWGISFWTNYKRGITFVSDIYAGTPAASMDLRVNDIILEWDGMNRPDHKRIVNHTNNVDAGKSFKIKIIRDGREMYLTLTAPPKVR
ncbi:MAG: TPM domain-containing protein [Rickettsiales bacterium]